VVLSVLVSAALHALILFGFNRHATPVRTDGPDIVAAAIATLDIQLPPEEPPPQEEETEQLESPQYQTSDTAGAASLPEPISSVAVADIAVVIRPTIPVRPLANVAQWTVPASQLRQPPVAADRIFKIDELDRRPVLIASVEPIYPPELDASPLDGVVVVRFVVTARGAIDSVSVVSSPHPAFGAAVTKALSRWQFRAGLKNGRAVSTEMELPVRFNPSST